MPDWLDKIGTLISEKEEDVLAADHPLILSHVKKNHPAPLSKPGNITYAQKKTEPTNSVADKKPVNPMASSTSKEDKFDALKRLRDLPRGTQVDSRVAAIQSLLGEVEIYKTLNMLRWPQGIICPTCKSSNVIRREPPPDAEDKRHYYVCLNCKGDGNPSDFDDLTGLPIETLQEVRQWILCWYLIGFCSVTQIAKILGLSLSEVLQMAHHGSELAQLPTYDVESGMSAQLTLSQKTSREAARKSQVHGDEENTRSASKSPLKPGYKSKK